MVVVYVPAGEFTMGSDDPFYNNERPPHSVALEEFWVDRTEVTNAQFQLCVEADVCKPPVQSGSFARSEYYGDEVYADYPVIFITWYQAVTYCNWAGARLPTEEEWEYIARGPQSWIFTWGDVPDNKRLNYCDASCLLRHADGAFNDGYPDTAPVGTYPTGASWCGALDVLGNVWEWVQDWFAYYPSEENPSWLPGDQGRVIRGGSWDTSLGHARGSYRGLFNPATSHDSIGFRCASSRAP